jgi:hypothetical protein
LVMSKGQIVMDGPRDAVLAQLSQNAQAAPPNATGQVGASGVSA